MEISDKLKRFLWDPEIQNLINNNEWEETYKKLAYSLNQISKFTQLLLSCRINPLNYMDYIPEDYLFNTDITNFHIPTHIKKIESSAFAYCYNLTNIIIPNSVISIGKSAFNHCTSLEKVILGNNVTNIDNAAFFECTSLTNIVIPNNVISIGEEAFNKCDFLANVVIGNNVKNIGNYAFQGCNLTTLIIPDSVTNIGSWAFADCTKLTSLTIGKNVTHIGIDILFGTKIEYINYNNTMDNWKKISGIQGKNRDEIVNNPTLFHCKIICIDGDLKFDSRALEWVEV